MGKHIDEQERRVGSDLGNEFRVDYVEKVEAYSQDTLEHQAEKDKDLFIRFT